MRRCAPFLAVCGALFALAACSSPQPPPTPFGVPAAATPTLPPETPADVELFGSRTELPGGLLLKQLGKVAQFGGPKDTDRNTYGFRIVVDSIAVDPKCDQYIPASERGHRLVVTARVETSAVFNASTDGIPTAYQWSTTGPDGVTEGPASDGYDCHTSKALAQDMRPSAKYRGEITVDTSTAAGQLVLANAAVWNYPTA